MIDVDTPRYRVRFNRLRLWPVMWKLMGRIWNMEQPDWPTLPDKTKWEL